MKRLKSDIWTQIDELSDRTSLGSHGKNREFSMNSQDQSSGMIISYFFVHEYENLRDHTYQYVLVF